MVINFSAVQAFFLPYYQNLTEFKFSYHNPLFWVFFMLLFFLLLKMWGFKKSFSFCAISIAILLSSTKLEGIIAGMVSRAGDVFDPIILRTVAIFLVLIVLLYYSFIRE